MDLTRITAPAVPIVTLDEAKAHLRVRHTREDGLISGLVDAAMAHLDGRDGILGRALGSQTWEWRFDCFPRMAAIELPLPPLQSVTSIKYLDGLGVETTLPSTDYVVETGHRQGRVRPAYGLTWPVARDESGAVRVRFVAGYLNPSEVPQPIKQAILLLVGHWYLNREAAGDAKGPHAFAVDALTFPYRVLL